VARPTDEKRPQELCAAIVQYLIRRGLIGLSLRPLARALGCTPRVLLYHFGSKERMVVEVLAQVRQRQRAAYGQIEGASFGDACHTIWKRMTAPDSEPLFRLFFETYGMALRQPRLYKAFLDDTIEDWLDLISSDFGPDPKQRHQARVFATVVLAGLRGFMLDFCATHDRKRLDRAVKLWLGSLQPMLSAIKAFPKPCLSRATP